GHRRPPQLRLESVGVNAIDHLFHVRIAGGEFLRVDIPIALDSLPAVVEGGPAKTELGDDGQGAVDLLNLEVAAVAPGAPDRLERLRRRVWKSDSRGDHDLAVFA